MNPDLHMADELKNTGAGNLFVVFGEPDIDFFDAEDGKMQVKINGVDVFHPQKGKWCLVTVTALPPGSLIPTTTKKASLSVMPISLAE